MKSQFKERVIVTPHVYDTYMEHNCLQVNEPPM